MAFFILTRFVLVKYSRAFVERPSPGTSSLVLQLTTVSLDICICDWLYENPPCSHANFDSFLQFQNAITFT